MRYKRFHAAPRVVDNFINNHWEVKFKEVSLPAYPVEQDDFIPHYTPGKNPLP